MLLATLGDILLGNMFAGKVVIATRTGKEQIEQVKKQSQQVKE